MATDRKAPRVRTLLQGRIEFNAGATNLTCRVRDLSEVGARLELSDAIALPSHFRLYLAKADRWYRARVRWHRDGFAGVEFEADGTTPKPAGHDHEPELARLHAEIARLRNLLEEIRADPSRARLLLDAAA